MQGQTLACQGHTLAQYGIEEVDYLNSVHKNRKQCLDKSWNKYMCGYCIDPVWTQAGPYLIIFWMSNTPWFESLVPHKTFEGKKQRIESLCLADTYSQTDLPSYPQLSRYTCVQSDLSSAWCVEYACIDPCVVAGLPVITSSLGQPCVLASNAQ